MAAPLELEGVRQTFAIKLHARTVSLRTRISEKLREGNLDEAEVLKLQSADVEADLALAQALILGLQIIADRHKIEFSPKPETQAQSSLTQDEMWAQFESDPRNRLGKWFALTPEYELRPRQYRLLQEFCKFDPRVGFVYATRNEVLKSGYADLLSGKVGSAFKAAFNNCRNNGGMVVSVLHRQLEGAGEKVVRDKMPAMALALDFLKSLPGNEGAEYVKLLKQLLRAEPIQQKVMPTKPLVKLADVEVAQIVPAPEVARAPIPASVRVLVSAPVPAIANPLDFVRRQATEGRPATIPPFPQKRKITDFTLSLSELYWLCVGISRITPTEFQPLGCRPPAMEEVMKILFKLKDRNDSKDGVALLTTAIPKILASYEDNFRKFLFANSDRDVGFIGNYFVTTGSEIVLTEILRKIYNEGAKRAVNSSG